jgi:pimeloyl-ACP methyl ester carboxylesterase
MIDRDFEPKRGITMTETFALTEKSFNMGEIVLNTVEVAADESADKPPMILLHGGLRWWQDWQPVIPQFAANWHVYAYDQRGHGKSGRDGDHYRLPDYTRDSVALLRAFVGEPAVLVGQSLGALVSLATAAQAPESVRALVLLDPPLFMREAALKPMQMEHTKAYSDWFSFLRHTLSTARSYDELVAQLNAVFPGGDEARVKFMADSVYGLDPLMIDVMLNNQLFEGFDTAAALEKITCPVLVVQADWDSEGMMRDEDADFVRAHLPNVTIHKMTGKSHLLLQEHPDLVVQETEAFLKTI